MKNKKIVVCLLIAVMVLGFTLTALVGCSGYKNIKSDKSEDHLDFLAQAVENTAENKNLNNLKLGASLNIETNSGKSKKNYSIDFGAALALAESSAGKNQATLEIKDVTDKKNSKNLISAYYFEETSKDVYLRLGDDTRFKLNGVKVRDVLKKNNAFLGDTASKEIADSVVEGVSDVVGYLNMIAQFDGAKVQVARNGKAYRLSVNLGKLLNGLINDESDETIKTMIETYLPALGLDLKAEDLASVLPALALNIDIKLSSKKNDAVITGLAADLSCDKANVTINKKDSKGALLELVIANDLKVKANLDFKFGEDVTFGEDIWEQYPAGMGAINLSASGTFEIKNNIENVNILNGMLDINIPADTYNLKIELKADPAKLVDMDFTGIHCMPHAVSEVINALDVALDLLNLEITKKDGSAFLQLKLEKKASADGTDHVAITALKLDAILGENPGLIGMIVDSLANEEMTLPEVWEMILGFGVFNQNDTKVDEGYVFGAGTNFAENTYVYAVDTAAGYVDANGDGEPDKDENGNFVVSKDFVLVNGRPSSKWENGYTKDSAGNWIVDVENGFVDEKNNESGKKGEPDGIPDVDSKGNFVVGDDFVLFQGTLKSEEIKDGKTVVSYQKMTRGLPLAKEYAGYKKNDEGKWVVDTENGYVKESDKKEIVAFDTNGNFSVAKDFKLVPIAGEYEMLLRPVKEADLTDAQKEYVKAQEEAANAPVIPEVVTNIIDALSIKVKNGEVSIAVAGLSFNYNEDAFKKGEDAELRAITLGANISLNKTGITISADLGGKLNQVEINGEPLGLPEKLSVVITINFSNIKYGAL